MKDELYRQIIKELVVDLIQKTEAKSTKKCIMKGKLKLQDYKNCLELARIEYKINHLISINDNKRM